MLGLLLSTAIVGAWVALVEYGRLNRAWMYGLLAGFLLAWFLLLGGD